jgi:hypothetical protein
MTSETPPGQRRVHSSKVPASRSAAFVRKDHVHMLARMAVLRTPRGEAGAFVTAVIDPSPHNSTVISLSSSDPFGESRQLSWLLHDPA